MPNQVQLTCAFFLSLFVKELSCSVYDGLVQERCNSIANTLELRPSCTNTSIWQKFLCSNQATVLEVRQSSVFPMCNLKLANGKPLSWFYVALLWRGIVLTPKTVLVDGLVQERCNSSALTMELHLSCTNLLMYISKPNQAWLPLVYIWKFLFCEETNCILVLLNFIHRVSVVRNCPWKFRCH